MSSTTKSSKNLLLLLEIIEADKVGIGIKNGDCKDKMVEKSPSKNLNGITGYLNPNARQFFTQLRQAFIKALIFQYFDLEYYIQIETDVLNYTISKVQSQLTLDNLGQ